MLIIIGCTLKCFSSMHVYIIFNMLVCWCQSYTTTLRDVFVTLYIFMQYLIEFRMFYFFSQNKLCYVLVTSNTRISVALQPKFIPCSCFAVSSLSDSPGQLNSILWHGILDWLNRVATLYQLPWLLQKWKREGCNL